MISIKSWNHEGTSLFVTPDLAIFVRSKRAGERVLARVSRYLETKLTVKVNKAKSKVAHVKESSVLGFKIHGRMRIPVMADSDSI